MKAYWTLVRREFGSHFFSWTGYVVIAVVLLLLGTSFANLLLALNARATDHPATEVFFSSYYFWIILLIAAPVITMRTFALEKSSGTFETLMTTPVSDLQVVLAKFTGAMLFYFLMWLPLLACLLIVRSYSNDPTVLEPGTIGTTFLGIFLLGTLYMSLGCFASAVTRSQIIAAMISFALGISLFLMSFVSVNLSPGSGWRATLFNYVEMSEHMRDFAAGVVDTRPLVFYLTFTGFFLFLTLKVVESRRWK